MLKNSEYWGIWQIDLLEVVAEVKVDLIDLDRKKDSVKNSSKFLMIEEIDRNLESKERKKDSLESDFKF